MKLFSKKEIKQEIFSKRDQALMQTIRLQRMAKKEIAEGNKINTNISQKKARIVEEFNNFLNDHAQKKQKLLKEITDLERRKEIALVPLDNLKISLIEKQEELDKYDKDLENKRQKLIEEQTSLNKQSELLKSKENELIGREETIIKQENNLNTRINSFNDIKKDFDENSKKINNKQEQIREELEEKEKQVNDTEKANNLTLKTIAEEKAKLKNEWIRVKDERQALNRAKAEILK